MSNINKIYDKASSIRLTILVCILLALVSVVGTLVPQGRSLPEYQDAYGQAVGNLILALGVDDLYHSAGFVLLLCLLALNLVACTSRRFPGIWRALRREHTPPPDPRMESWRYRETYACAGLSGPEDEAFRKALAGALGRGLSERSLGDGSPAFFAERGRYSRLGPYLAHVAILLILLGGLLGAFVGFKGFLTLPEGGEASDVWLGMGRTEPLGFRIRCNDFVHETYPDGTPKDYRSEVSLLDGKGQKILDRSIRVNHPLSHGGITFYQSSYGEEPTLTFRVRNRETGEESVVETGLDTPFGLPGGDAYHAVAASFSENMRIPAEMMRVTAFPREDLGPVAGIRLFRAGRVEQEFYVFRDLPALNEKREGPYLFQLEAYRTVPYTGLQVVRDPGTTLVWIGCTLLVLGFLMALLMDNEVVWVTTASRQDGTTEVRLAGRCVRHPGLYAARFERRAARLRAVLSPWLKSE